MYRSNHTRQVKPSSFQSKSSPSVNRAPINAPSHNRPLSSLVVKQAPLHQSISFRSSSYQSIRSNGIQSLSRMNRRVMSTNAAETVPPEAGSQPAADKHDGITIGRICKDIGLESVIPILEAPPHLPSLDQFAHRKVPSGSSLSDTKQQGEAQQQASSGNAPVTLYDLTLLSTEDYRVLIPNDVNRNRLKEHLRMLITTGLVADGHPPITQEEFSKLLDDISKRSPEPSSHTTAAVAGETSGTTSTTAATTAKSETGSVPDEKAAPDAAAVTAATPGNTSIPDASKVRSEQSVADEIKSSSIQALQMPQFFDSMKEGTVTEWHVPVGQHFVRGHILCDIETDIAEISFEAPEPGHLSEILIKPGESVKVGDAIAVMRYVEEKH